MHYNFEEIYFFNGPVRIFVQNIIRIIINLQGYNLHFILRFLIYFFQKKIELKLFLEAFISNGVIVIFEFL